MYLYACIYVYINDTYQHHFCQHGGLNEIYTAYVYTCSYIQTSIHLHVCIMIPAAAVSICVGVLIRVVLFHTAVHITITIVTIIPILITTTVIIIIVGITIIDTAERAYHAPPGMKVGIPLIEL
jgi:hypothetical protein